MATRHSAPSLLRDARGQVLPALLLGLLGACSSGPSPRPVQSEASESPVSTNARPEEPPVSDPVDPPEPEDSVAARDPLPVPEPVPAPVDDEHNPFAVVDRQLPQSPPDTLAEPSGAVPNAQFVGRFRVSGSIPSRGGAIGWSREYELRADRTFQMSAYPPITTSGRWRRVGRVGARAELVHDTLRAPDGRPHVESVRGLAHPGEPLSVLEIGNERYPRVLETP